MCLVIDACCWSLVFRSQNQGHNSFAPVLKWIAEGNGAMIYGGTKYGAELRKAQNVLNLVRELKISRRAIEIPAGRVDALATDLKQKHPEPQFNDEHIVALVIASKCSVVCTNDDVAISYLKRADIFADYVGAKRPKIYRGYKNHIKLCCDKHITGVCKVGR